MVGSQVAKLAKDELSLLTGHKPDTVSSLRHDEHGWHVTVDMIELKRIPESNDVLATYEMLLDENGTMLSYERVRRYYRSQVSD